MMVSSSAGDVLERRRLMAPEAPFLVALDFWKALDLVLRVPAEPETWFNRTGDSELPKLVLPRICYAALTTSFLFLR